ncbi:hypothetical protein HK100_002661 [Physocladia obscura]|uniref:Pentatricopeptide repeat-containing protein n=1 Tax=Physocladia obscura TaxID=109957 RepID=A0AAD5SY72_9FUNG|nr:hypothetical protein HK100_002661 [Physocladia obscura]
MRMRMQIHQLATDLSDQQNVTSRISRSKKLTIQTQTETLKITPLESLKTALSFSIENRNQIIATKAFKQLRDLARNNPDSGASAALDSATVCKFLALFYQILADENARKEDIFQLLDMFDLAFDVAGESLLIEEDVLNPFLNTLDRLDQNERFKKEWKRVVSNAASTGARAPRLSLQTYNTALKFFGRLGLSVEAAQTFELLKISSIPVLISDKPDPLLASYFNEEKYHAYTNPPDKDSYYHLISAHINAKPRNFTAALKVLEEMTVKASPPPTAAIFTLLIHGAGKIRDFGAMAMLRDAMTAASEYPNHFTYNAIIDSYAKAGDMENAYGAIKDWQKAVIERNSDPLVPNLSPPTQVTYNTLLSMCAKDGNMVQDAKQLIDMMMTTVGVSATTVTTYMDLYKRRGEYEKCREVFEMFEKKAGIRKFTAGYNVLLSCAGYIHDIDTLNALYEEMIQYGCRPSIVTFRIMAKAFAKKLDLDGLKFMVDEINHYKFEQDLVISEAIANAVVRHAQFQPIETRSSTVSALMKLLPKNWPQSSKMSNFILEAHVQDYLQASRTPMQEIREFNLQSFLNSMNYDSLFSPRYKTNTYTLEILIDLLEKEINNGVKIIHPIQTSKIIDEVFTSCVRSEPAMVFPNILKERASKMIVAISESGIK